MTDDGRLFERSTLNTELSTLKSGRDHGGPSSAYRPAR